MMPPRGHPAWVNEGRFGDHECLAIEAVEFATLEWVDWFNNRRLLEPIGNIPPPEVEQRYYAKLERPAMAASLKPNGLRGTRGGSRRNAHDDLVSFQSRSCSKQIDDQVEK